MFSICSSLNETVNAVKPQEPAVHAGGSPPALGLMGEKNDQSGCGEHARKPDESRISVAFVHAGKAFKTRAGNALPSVKFTGDRLCRATCRPRRGSRGAASVRTTIKTCDSAPSFGRPQSSLHIT